MGEEKEKEKEEKYGILKKNCAWNILKTLRQKNKNKKHNTQFDIIHNGLLSTSFMYFYVDSVFLKP